MRLQVPNNVGYSVVPTNNIWLSRNLRSDIVMYVKACFVPKSNFCVFPSVPKPVVRFLRFFDIKNVQAYDHIVEHKVSTPWWNIDKTPGCQKYPEIEILYPEFVSQKYLKWGKVFE